MLGCLLILTLAATQPAEIAGQQPGMVMLQYADPRFRQGLERHGLLDNSGYRLLNTGFVPTPFGERWSGHVWLEQARASGRPYYIDRITGGMPYQSLEGIGEIAESLEDDPNFLGFQVHEWGNSPIYDYRRIHKLLLDKDLPFDAEHFSTYEGRTSLPYFSGGDFSVYSGLYRPLKSLADVDAYLEDYFKRLVDVTRGQICSVTGHIQLHHAALRLGAKNVMAEIGNQVTLTAFQIACVRGAAKQFGKPFGAYYETWGGNPFGCTCATDFSPWFATREQFDNFHEMGSVGPEHGSGRSLQRRLMFFAWLSGAAYWAEEWGTENYFADWDDYPLTDYGRVVKDFLATKQGYPRPEPITPAALVLPPGAFGLDGAFIAGGRQKLHNLVPPDDLHVRLRAFAAEWLDAKQGVRGTDAQNLTSSPWIGCFDVLGHDAPRAILESYPLVLFFDEAQAQASALEGPETLVYEPGKNFERIKGVLQAHLPFQVQADVGVVQARCGQDLLVGLFNTEGVTKTADGETRAPEATRQVRVQGPCEGCTPLCGAEFVQNKGGEAVDLELPAGEVAVLCFKR